MHPPFLFGRAGAGEHSAVTATLDLQTAVVLMTVRGSWDRRLSRDTSAGFRKCLSEHPAALIVDLLTMIDPVADGLATWTGADRIGRTMTPPVRLLMCLAEDTILAERLAEHSRVPVFGTVGQARAAAAAMDAPDRLRLLLAPGRDAPRLARAKVTEGCAAWGLPDLAHRGRLVVSELVANAVEHAGTPITLLVSRRAGGLHLIVGDGDPRLPELLPPWPAPGSRPAPSGRGYGLRMVDAAATVWGAMPAGDGKMVWATVYPAS